jgi:hypothetical protein
MANVTRDNAGQTGKGLRGVADIWHGTLGA